MGLKRLDDTPCKTNTNTLVAVRTDFSFLLAQAFLTLEVHDPKSCEARYLKNHTDIATCCSRLRSNSLTRTHVAVRTDFSFLSSQAFLKPEVRDPNAYEPRSLKKHMSFTPFE